MPSLGEQRVGACLHRGVAELHVARHRQQNDRDDFEERLRGKALEDARRAARAQIVARVAVPEAGEPTGQVVPRFGMGA